MKTLPLKFVLVAGAALAAAPALAAEVEVAVTHYWTAEYATTSLGDPVTNLILVGETTGPQLADEPAGGPLDALSMTCPFHQEFVIPENRRNVSGYCRLNDAAGDVILARFNCTGQVTGVCAGTFEYFAGTGKFAGISGGGETEVHLVARGPDGRTSVGFSRSTGKADLPAMP